MFLRFSLCCKAAITLDTAAPARPFFALFVKITSHGSQFQTPQHSEIMAKKKLPSLSAVAPRPTVAPVAAAPAVEPLAPAAAPVEPVAVASTPSSATASASPVTPRLIVAQRKFNRWYVYFKGVAPAENVGRGCHTAKSALRYMYMLRRRYGALISQNVYDRLTFAAATEA